MNFKRIGRALVCLLLVCCLCFNMATIPAKAIAAEYILIPAAIACTAMLIGLGPRPGDAVDDFNMAIHGFTQFLEDTTTWVKAGAIQVWKDVTGKYYVEESLIDTLRNWLFDSGTVSSAYTSDLTFSVPFDSSAYRFYALSGSFAPCIVKYVWDDGSVLYRSYIASSSPFTCKRVIGTGSAQTMSVDNDNGVYFVSVYSSSALEMHPAFPIVGAVYLQGRSDTSCEFEGISLSSVSITSQDLILNSLIDPSVSIATGYADWAAGAISIPGIGAPEGTDEEDYVRAYPLGMGQTMEETQSMLQTDVQAGTGTYTDTATDTEVITGTFADTAVGAFITSLIDALWTPFRWIGEKLDLLGQLLSDVVSGAISIPEALSALWTSVIVEPIIEGISVIFVPQGDFLTGKVVELQAQFPHITPIIEVGQFIGHQMSGFDTSPPIIYIDLGATRGSYDIGGKVAFIDMTWYAEYKPTVDTFLSALLWIVFWWKMFKRLPGLISGMPGDFVMDGLHDIGLADHLPSRNAAYEIQRRDNHNSVWRRR